MGEILETDDREMLRIAVGAAPRRPSVAHRHAPADERRAQDSAAESRGQASTFGRN